MGEVVSNCQNCQKCTKENNLKGQISYTLSKNNSNQYTSPGFTMLRSKTVHKIGSQLGASEYFHELLADKVSIHGRVHCLL